MDRLNTQKGIFYFLILGIGLLFSECRKDPPVHIEYPGWKVYTTKNSGLTNDQVGGLFMDRLSNVWMSSGLDLIKYNDTTWKKIIFPTDDLIGGISGIGMGDNVWFSGRNGLYKMNIFDYDYQQYTQFNSGLPSNVCGSFAVDSINNILWIGTGYGLAKFDGTNWQVFNSSNSPMTANEISGLTIDRNGSIWFSARRWALSTTDTTAYIQFNWNNSIWNVFNSTNAHFPIYGAHAIVVDNENAVWITGIDLDKYDDGNWTHYNSNNISDIPNDPLTVMAIDTDGKIWIGTFESGIVTYQNGIWEHLTMENSGLPTNHIQTIRARSNGEIWIGTTEGLAVYKKP